MLGLRKICVILKQCCLTSDLPPNDVSEFKSPQSNETVMTLAKTSNSNRKTEEVHVLTLSVIETSHMTLGEKFVISPSGLISSIRKSKDNCVYAGNTRALGSNIINDLLLPEDENGTGKRHFMIKYHKEKHRYYLKDMGEGLGTFIRLDRSFKLQNTSIISFGDSHMIIHLDNSFITLRFIQGPRTDYKNTFSPEDSPIRIGRMSDCDIRFEDSSLSRYHCFLYFDENWLIQDGDGKKSSTNGTWLFAEQFTELDEETVFKAGETLFRCSLSIECI